MMVFKRVPRKVEINKAFIFTCALSVFYILPISSKAEEVEPPLSFSTDQTLVVDEEEKAVTLRIEGKDPEKGTWHLFVKNSAQNDFNHTLLMDELNSIEPAAGVQFKIEF